MPSIADTLKTRVKDVGPSGWDDLALRVNKRLEPDDHVTFHSLRKIAYGERPNLGLKVAQALLDEFAAQDKREQKVRV